MSNDTARQTTVSINIPAYNEEKNMKKLLDSIVRQRQGDYILNSINVYLDKSNDTTEQIVKSYKKASVNLIKMPKRTGKSLILEKIFRSRKEDVLVLLDADVVLSDASSISNLVEPLKSSKVYLTSGKPLKRLDDSRFSKVTDVSDFLQNYIKDNARGGNNVYGCHGRMIAINKELYSTLKFPITAAGNDAYLYFSAIQAGGEFRYVNDATCVYKAPAEINDFQKQLARLNSSKRDLVKRFGNLAVNEYKIPFSLYVRAVYGSFRRKPMSTVSYIFIKFRGKLSRNNPGKAAWEVSLSTK